MLVTMPKQKDRAGTSRDERRRDQVRDRIAKLRLDRGLTQKEMSRRMGISRPFYTQIESGYRRLDLLYLFAICRALNVDPAQLLEGI